MHTPAQFDILLPAMRLGFARAAAAAGLTPSEAQVKIAEFQKKAGALDILQQLASAGAITLVAGGAIAGGMSGVARHRLERDAAGKGDPNITADEAKADGYDQMSADLRTGLAASAPVYKAPRVQEAMR